MPHVWWTLFVFMLEDQNKAEPDLFARPSQVFPPQCYCVNDHQIGKEGFKRLHKQRPKSCSCSCDAVDIKPFIQEEKKMCVMCRPNV